MALDVLTWKGQPVFFEFLYSGGKIAKNSFLFYLISLLCCFKHNSCIPLYYFCFIASLLWRCPFKHVFNNTRLNIALWWELISDESFRACQCQFPNTGICILNDKFYSEDVKFVSSFSTASTKAGKLLSVKQSLIIKLNWFCGTSMWLLDWRLSPCDAVDVICNTEASIDETVTEKKCAD